MAARPFTARTRTVGTVAVLELGGDVDVDAKAPLEAAYAEAVAGGATRLVLGFADVGYINSTGIAVIVGVLAQARAAGHDVVAYGLSDHYREIFTITRLADFMPLFADVGDALAHAA